MNGGQTAPPAVWGETVIKTIFTGFFYLLICRVGLNIGEPMFAVTTMAYLKYRPHRRVTALEQRDGEAPERKARSIVNLDKLADAQEAADAPQEAATLAAARIR